MEGRNVEGIEVASSASFDKVARKATFEKFAHNPPQLDFASRVDSFLNGNLSLHVSSDICNWVVPLHLGFKKLDNGDDINRIHIPKNLRVRCGARSSVYARYRTTGQEGDEKADSVLFHHSVQRLR